VWANAGAGTHVDSPVVSCVTFQTIPFFLWSDGAIVLFQGWQAPGRLSGAPMSGTERETLDRRRDKRVPLLLPCLMTVSTGRAGAIVVDLSINGWRLRTRQVLLPGKLLLLHVESDKPSFDLRIDGAIVRSVRSTDYGVEFLHSRSEERIELLQVLSMHG
jgi:hypothetical protein